MGISTFLLQLGIGLDTLATMVLTYHKDGDGTAGIAEAVEGVVTNFKKEHRLIMAARICGYSKAELVKALSSPDSAKA